MNQAGLVALGAASIYGGVGYLFAIAMSEGDLSPLAALRRCVRLGHGRLCRDSGRPDRPHQSARLHDADARRGRDGQSRRDAGGSARLHLAAPTAWSSISKGAILGYGAADFANAAQLLAGVPGPRPGLSASAHLAVRRSRLGAILRAIRENEERMRFSGFDTYCAAPGRVRASSISIAGARAGCCMCSMPASFRPKASGLSVSTNALVAALIGRRRQVGGAVVGGAHLRLRAGRIRRARCYATLDRRRDRRVHRSLPRGVVGGLIDAARGWARALVGRGGR